MTDVSDAGGVAARIGFKYQDHIAASFVLEMIGDRRVLRVECETSDDITRIFVSDGAEVPEYVQVKTTDRDNKWNTKEIYTRQNKNTPSSLSEKSLLADKHQPNARFRIVTRRSVNASLQPLLEPIELRDPNGEIVTLAKRLKARHPKTVSLVGHDLEYWALNTVWDARSGLEYVETHNLQRLSRLAEEAGANPSHSQASNIYRDLLELVEAAASASRRDESQKVIARTAALAWWAEQLAKVQTHAARIAKPYRIRGDRFFVEVHNLEHRAKRRSLGYDAQYERRVWRSAQLSQYLVTWMAELTLKASELAEIDQLNLRQKLEAGLRAIQAQRTLDARSLLGEALLHAVLRHYFGSEPIACKLFHRSSMGDRVTRNAHIVHNDSGDQLWLGRTYQFDGEAEDTLLGQISNDLQAALETEVLREEQQVIIQLREPQHLLSNSLSEAFSPGAPIDRLIEVLCVPILVAYDSEVLQAGYSEEYLARLKAEIGDFAERCIAGLPIDVAEIQIHIILVPIENLAALTRQFETEAGLR